VKNGTISYVTKYDNLIVRRNGMPETVDAILKQHSRRPENLIPILQDVQKDLGYISPESVKGISRYLRISENQIFGVSSFYAQFRFTRPGRHSLKVCLGTACHVRGGATVLDTLENVLEVKCGDTTPDGRFDLERVACLGCCALSPVVQIDKRIYSRVAVNKLSELLKFYE
jgi:NADH:ubiquinone oxidoreductase subunit E